MGGGGGEGSNFQQTRTIHQAPKFDLTGVFEPMTSGS